MDDRINIKNAKDAIDQQSNKVNTEIENAYRDGYYSAACLVVKAMKHGFTIDQLNRWLSKLENWKNKEDKSNMIYPPKLRI
jgi:hypothetical protein